MEISGVDHILLYCIMLLLAYIYDRQYRYVLSNHYDHRVKQSLPVIAFFLGLVFVFTEGLRYGRGVDQLGNYGPNYLKYTTSPELCEHVEWLFVLINKLVYYVDFTVDVLPFGLIFVAFAAIFWISLCIFYRNYKKNTSCFLILAILATNYITEWTIRQGVSFSFILLGLYFIDKLHWKSVALCFVAAFSIHHGNAVAVLLLLACFFFLNKKPLNWKITIPLFIVLEYTMQVSVFLELVNNIFSNINLTSLGGNFQGYIDNDSFEKEAELMAEWKRGAGTQLITVLFYVSIFYVGYCYHYRYSKDTFIYNAFVIGIMIYEPFRLSGSVIRLFLPAISLWFVPVSLALAKYKDFRVNKYFKLSMLIIFVYLISYYGRYIFFNPEANYVWNI